MDTTPFDRPAHVPADLVRDNYPFAMGRTTTDNPFTALLEELHNGPEIIYATNAYPIDIPAWVPRRLNDIQAIYLDTEHFSSESFSPFPTLVGESWRVIPVEIDPPQHFQYRALLNPLFTPKRLQQLEDQVRRTAREYIDQFKEAGQCEFMSQFAMRFPIAVFLDLMGMPRERMEQFLEWEGLLLHSMDLEGIIRGTQQVVAYLREIIEERRNHPGDDLVSYLVNAEMDGRKLTDDELVGCSFNLYIGGLDTVTTNIAWQIRHLAEHQEDQQALRENPSLIPVAVEALYRRYPAVTTFRTCVKQIDIAGVTIMPGDKVAMSTTLGNTDPAAWENPMAVAIDRQPPRSLTFGFGVHRCVGVTLARRESVIAIEELLSAIPQFRLQNDVPLVTELGPILQPKNIPLVW